MAATGFGELILLLLTLGGFGVKANPNPPPTQAVVRYAVEDADVMVFVDVEAMVPHNYDAFTKLPADPRIKALPSMHAELAKVIKQAEEGRAVVRAQLGFDPVVDIKWAAFWVKLKAKGAPEFVGVVGGRFPADVVERAAALDKKRKLTKIEGRSAIEDDDGLAALAPDGSIIFGTPSLVKARLAAAYKPSTRPGTVTQRSAELFGERPFFAAAFRPSPALIAATQSEMKSPDVALVRDFVTGHEFFGVVMTPTTLGWTAVLRTQSGYARAVMASEGMIQILRSGHLFMRGAAQVVLASLDSYVASDPSLAKVIKLKPELLAMVNGWTGDGSFAAKLDRDDKNRRVAVRLTGKTFAEVMPIGGVLLPAVLGALYGFR